MKKWKGVFGVAVVAIVSDCAQHSSKNIEKKLLGSLLENPWRIESIQSAGVIDYSPAQLTFTADGKFSGNGTCNRIFGDYSIQGARLVISDHIGATRMMCPEALMNQEQKLLQALPGVHAISFDKGVLTLSNAHGDEVIRAAAITP